MSKISSRKELKDYCLRRLGFPVIDINVSEEQIEDRLSDAFQYYIDYHYDAVSKVYYKHIVTQEDIENRYLTVPDHIIGVTRVLPLNNLLSKSYMWDIRYQLILNNLWDLTSTSILPYTIAMQHIRNLELLFVGEVPIRFQRHENRVFVDLGWGTQQCPEGTTMVLECYQAIDPETYTDVYDDRWLKKYATAMIRRQWGENLIKFKGDLNLPGGLTLNGEQIYSEATREIEKLEAEMLSQYSIPCEFMMG
jgi:hypothetical protein